MATTILKVQLHFCYISYILLHFYWASLIQTVLLPKARGVWERGIPSPCCPARASQVVPVIKNPAANAGDTRDVGSIPGLGRSLGIGNGNPLEYSCLENPMDREAWQAATHRVTKSWRHWSDLARVYCPIKYSTHWKRASLEAQLVKNPPAMRETWVRSLGWEDALEKHKATHSSTLAWRIPWTVVHGVKKNRTRLSDLHLLEKLSHFLRVPLN